MKLMTETADLSPFQAPAAARSGNHLDSKYLKIMVIDDWRKPQESLALYLQFFQEMKFADNLDDGLRHLSKGSFDLVFLDLCDLAHDAHHLVRQIQKIDPSISIILTMGKNSMANLQEVINAGGHGFIQFPFKLSEIQKTIKSASVRTKSIRLLKKFNPQRSGTTTDSTWTPYSHPGLNAPRPSTVQLQPRWTALPTRSSL